jgi:phosphoglycolate phosphatase
LTRRRTEALLRSRISCLVHRLEDRGPVCGEQLFTGDLLTEIANTLDPIEVFYYSVTVSDEMAARVEAEMADLAVAAIATVEPTPYAHEVIASSRESGRTVGVVSNNSTRAVNAYPQTATTSAGVRLVAARASHDPALFKPSLYLIREALLGLRAESEVSVLAAIP